MRAIRKKREVLRDGFPLPTLKGLPRGNDERTEWAFAELAHLAFDTGHPKDREEMKRNAIDMLLSDRPLPPSLREWLAYVLVRVDEVPHGHPSGPPKDYRGRQTYLLKLARFVAEYEIAHPDA